MQARAVWGRVETSAQSWMTHGVRAVWKRNFKYFLKSWSVSLFWIVLEPSFYLAAIGFGLGRFVDEVNGQSYLHFYYPALLATTAMFVPFFEATYSSFTKMTHQKTFQTIMLAPIGPDEIVRGEIMWAATKGFMGVIGVTLIASFFGLGGGIALIPSLIVLAITCWVFAAIGMLATSLARNYDSFIYSTSGIVIPMSLFSGTYFPLDEFPNWVHRAAYLLPLTHSVRVTRGLMLGDLHYSMLLNVLVLLVLAIWLSQIASQRISKKIYF